MSSVTAVSSLKAKQHAQLSQQHAHTRHTPFLTPPTLSLSLSLSLAKTGVSGFSEEFNIVPVGPHRTRVLLRQRFPKGPILTTLLKIPGTRSTLQYLVRNWNYQIGLEDYCVMQGQAHNIDDLGAPNWRATGAGDDLIIKFWKWKRQALKNDATDAEYYQRWDGITLDPSEIALSAPDAAEVRSQAPTHAGGDIAAEGELRQDYITNMPAADYPPINWRPYPLVQEIVERHMQVCEEEATRTHSTQLPFPCPYFRSLSLSPHCLLCPPHYAGARHPFRAPRDARLPAARQLAIGPWRLLRPSGGRGRDPAERLARRGGRRAAWGVEMRERLTLRDCGHIRTTPSHVDRCTHACGLREHDPPVCMYEDGMRNS